MRLYMFFLHFVIFEFLLFILLRFCFFFRFIIIFFQFYIYYYNFRLKPLCTNVAIHIRIHTCVVKSILTGSDSHVCLNSRYFQHLLVFAAAQCLLNKNSIMLSVSVVLRIKRAYVLNIKNISYSVAHSFTKQF